MREELREWLRFIRAQHHILRERPGRFFQQAANQPDSSAPGRSAVERARRGLERRPWLRWTNKPQQWDPCLVTLLRGGKKRGFAFSPDSRRVIVGWSDYSLRVFDAETGRDVAILRAPEHPWYVDFTVTVIGCRFAADGGRIVTWMEDGTITLWDAAMGDEVATLAVHDDHAAIYSCSVSPDGRWIAAAFEGEPILKLWDAQDGLQRWAFPLRDDGSPITTFSRDSRFLASASVLGTVELWDVDIGCKHATLSLGFAPETIEFSKDGTQLLEKTHIGEPAVWNAVTSEKVAEFRGHSERVTACAFSSDADQVITASMDGTMKLWSSSGKEILTFRGHTKGVLDCAFSPDGRFVASASYDQTLKLWDCKTGHELATFTGHASPVGACTFSPDGSKIISMSSESTRIWDATARTGPVTSDEASATADWEQADQVFRGRIRAHRFKWPPQAGLPADRR
ncbi:MAG: WD40 repeat domain-containing protein [Acidobacteriota bacterium]|nr:WD40 repeat domain-containing protein [Acidobacteriota bacterium]